MVLAALVGDQYIVSVAHNVGYRNVDFGMEGNNPDQHRFGYNIVKRNNYKNDRTHPLLRDRLPPTSISQIRHRSCTNRNGVKYAG